MKISVITATRNCASTVADCMASIRRQTHPHIEQIVIDGASSDDTLAIVKGSGHSVETLPPHPSRLPLPTAPGKPHAARRTVLLSEPDNGIYDAMNKGILLATGDIIGILNSDDSYADDEVLARVAAVFADPTVMSCYGDLVYVKTGERLKVKGERSTDPSSPSSFHLSQDSIHRYWKAGDFDADRFYQGWMPPHPTFFVRRSVYEHYGTFRMDMGSAADYELMLRFLVKQRISATYIPCVLVAMRLGGVSNATLNNRLRANQMDRRAWKVNGLTPRPWTIFLKPLRKINQWLVKGRTPALLKR